MAARPHEYCDPDDSFGKVRRVKHRVWRPPAPGSDPSEFRAAVYQHLVSIRLRKYKNQWSISRALLVTADSRHGAGAHWDRVLNGRQWMDLRDLMVLREALVHWRHDFEPLPPVHEFDEFLAVVEMKDSPPLNWLWPDR